MVSLRALERDSVVNVVRRNEVDWLSAVDNLKYLLIKRGFDYDRAEELSHAAMVEVYESNEFISRQRVNRDMIGAAYGIAHRESAERQTIETADDLPLTEQAGRLRIERRASYETTTAQTRNAIAAKRAERKLLENYGWLISQAVQTVAPEQRLMRYLSELAYSAFGSCGDTTQVPPIVDRTVVVSHAPKAYNVFENGIGISPDYYAVPNTGISTIRVNPSPVEMPVETFADCPVDDRAVCSSVSNQFRDGVPFANGSHREIVALLMLSGI